MPDRAAAAIAADWLCELGQDVWNPIGSYGGIKFGGNPG